MENRWDYCVFYIPIITFPTFDESFLNVIDLRIVTKIRNENLL